MLSVQFDLNGILQAWPGRILPGCRMFDLPSKPPSTVAAVPEPSFLVFLRRYPERSAVSARRVLIRDIIPSVVRLGSARGGRVSKRS